MSEPIRPKVTISDVAKACGVSPATVSLVLRDQPGIGEETRQKVLETAQLLGYITKINQSPSKVVAKTMGLVIKVRPNDMPNTNLFYTPVLTGIELLCRQNQMNLLYANMLVDENNVPLEIPRLMTEGEADGLLLVGMLLEENTAGLLGFHQQNRPVVLVDAYATQEHLYDAVVTDNVYGGYLATQHLIEQGHQHIGIVGSHEQSYPSILERRVGYKKAMEAAQLAPYFIDCGLTQAEAEEATRHFLKKHPQITALFACNDLIAVALLKLAQELNLAVPQQLSIIGFDNIDLAQHVTPALTTVRVDKMGMGRLAVQLLINRLEYPESSKVRGVIQPQLIIRQSVGKPPRP